MTAEALRLQYDTFQQVVKSKGDILVSLCDVKSEVVRCCLTGEATASRLMTPLFVHETSSEPMTFLFIIVRLTMGRI